MMNRHSRGFTLIELMVGIALGVTVISSILTLGANISKQNRLHDSTTTVQYNGSHASRVVSNMLLYSGYQGCQIKSIGIMDSDFTDAKQTFATELIGAANTDFPIENFETETFLAFDYGSGGTPTPTPPSLINAALTNLDPAPRENSSVLVSYSVSTEFIPTTAEMADGASSITIADNTIGLAQDDYAFITNCFTGTVFRIGNDPTTSITHDAFSMPYAEGSNVHRVNFDIIYVGEAGYNDSRGNPVYALFRSRNGTVRQMAEGVNLMKAQFKMTDSSDGSVQYRAPSDAGFDVSLSKNARVGFMVTSISSPLFENDTRSYTILGDTYSHTDLNGEFNTKSYKQVFTLSALMRNK